MDKLQLVVAYKHQYNYANDTSVKYEVIQEITDHSEEDEVSFLETAEQVRNTIEFMDEISLLNYANGEILAVQLVEEVGNKKLLIGEFVVTEQL